jgi:N-acetylglucosamine-6-phosphate deacetylase
MALKCIINAKIIVQEGISPYSTLCYDEKIVSLGGELFSEDIEVIDAKGAYVSAGFIDMHIHGSLGADVMDATFEALECISTVLPSTGTTSFLATTMTMSKRAIDKALMNLKTYRRHVSGAQILGAHLEGPFINPEKCGAQDLRYIQTPVAQWLDVYKDEIKMITLAPEIVGSKKFILDMQKRFPHIILSIGHSNATYEEAKESFVWGVSHATHLFNAMSPFHHRSPGIVGAVFDTNITCDVIADGIHTHASTLELIYKMKKNNLILITDSMRAGCMKEGTYDLGGKKVEVRKGKAFLKNGTLAGSVLKMNEALNYMVTHTSMNRVDAIHSVTSIPAKKLSLAKGELKVGYDADIVIFDENFSIISTIILGKEKYRRSECLDS